MITPVMRNEEGESLPPAPHENLWFIVAATPPSPKGAENYLLNAPLKSPAFARRSVQSFLPYADSRTTSLVWTGGTARATGSPESCLKSASTAALPISAVLASTEVSAGSQAAHRSLLS